MSPSDHDARNRELIQWLRAAWDEMTSAEPIHDGLAPGADGPAESGRETTTESSS
ncbi:hypothetical protein [Deinococcus multiflagellatus]|uniref:Uncharacterized protein n=1 Tax=Deinococcus multiflagellatus TaxID=1656887 RepID=A0ABW1ZTU4_9DEIO|nr:hypothetical protein [Deinococcus multiflagellatus]MBZ9714493.1 hypothetical protein [Deinococcus multiflagellatus]